MNEWVAKFAGRVCLLCHVSSVFSFLFKRLTPFPRFPRNDKIHTSNILAAGIHYQGVKRELAQLRAARAAIRPQVEATLVGRSSVDATYRQVAALAGAARGATRWSAILGALAAHLPDDASLTAFRARGDSVFMDGVATRAAPVFDDIAGTPGIAGVRATAPVRREAIEGELPLEHFAIGAQLFKAKR